MLTRTVPPIPRGFSLIEMMIAVVIVGLLLMAGVPAYTTWIQNLQIRTGAEAILNGMQLARAEAVRRNTNVRFVLTALPSPAWTVSVAADGSQIQSRPGGEGTRNAVVTVTPAGATTVTFNGFGAVIDIAPVTQVDVDSAVLPAADSRELRVRVSTGGGVKMCDPNIAAGDPLACS